MDDEIRSRIACHLKRAIRDVYRPWDVLDEGVSDDNDKNCDAFADVAAACSVDSVISIINQACDDIELELTGKIKGWLRASVNPVVEQMSCITQKLKKDCEAYCRYWESKRGLKGFLGNCAFLIEHPWEVPKAFFGTSSVQQKVEEFTDPIVSSITEIGAQIVSFSVEVERAISAKMGESFKFNVERST